MSLYGDGTRWEAGGRDRDRWGRVGSEEVGRLCWRQVGTVRYGSGDANMLFGRLSQHSRCGIMCCSTVQYSTVQHSTVQYKTVQYSTAQYSTVQHSKGQYKAVQYSTVQYSTA